MDEPTWLAEHREATPYPKWQGPMFSQLVPRGDGVDIDRPKLLADKGFNNHFVQDGHHVSPSDEGMLLVGVDDVKVRLINGVDEEALKRVLVRNLNATTGLSPDSTPDPKDWEELLRGGLNQALETQVITFEVFSVSRCYTHQAVRTRKGSYGQQSQRATWYGDRPNVRMPQSIFLDSEAREAFREATEAAWKAYQVACDRGISYQDARYILPEGTVNYMTLSYPLNEFFNMFAYRGCSMFLWEMVHVTREMRRVLLEAHPWLEPYVKISCEKGALCGSCGGTGKFSYANPTPNGGSWVEGIAEGSDCPLCDGLGGNRKCTFNGWENVEGVCDLPWAKQANRVFLPSPKFRIGDQK